MSRRRSKKPPIGEEDDDNVPDVRPSTQVTSEDEQQAPNEDGELPDIPPSRNVTTREGNNDEAEDEFFQQPSTSQPSGRRGSKAGRERDKLKKKVGYRTNRAAKLRKEKAAKDKNAKEGEDEEYDMFEISTKAKKTKREKNEPWMKDIFSSDGQRLFKKRRRWGRKGAGSPTPSVKPAVLMTGYNNDGYDDDDSGSDDDHTDDDEDDDDNFIPPEPPEYVTHFPLQVEKVVYKTVKKNNETINNTKFRNSAYTAWIVTKVYTKVTQSIPFEENKEQVRESLKVIDVVTQIPLSEIWNKVNRIIPLILFLTSLGLTLFDLITSPVFLYFKLTSLIFDVLEIIFVGCVWFIKKLPVYKSLNEAEKENFDKKQQYGENLLTEVLLYPLIVCAVFGVTVDEAYKFNNWLNILIMLLLIIDVLDLLYTYFIRMKMVWRLLKDIREKIPNITNVRQKFMGDFTVRLFTELVGNTLLFAIMLIMLGEQIHKENTGRKDYYCSFTTAFMIVCAVILPIFSLVLFIVVNYIWVLEMLIKINLHVIQEEKFREEMEDEYGALVEGVMTYATENALATPARLRDIELVPLSQRLLYGLREWWVLLLVFMWSLLVIMFAFLFDKTANPSLSYALTAVFLILVIMSNLQVALIAVLSNGVMLVVLIAVMMYGICKKRGESKKTKLTTMKNNKTINNNNGKNNELESVKIEMNDFNGTRPGTTMTYGSDETSSPHVSYENLRSISAVNKSRILHSLNKQDSKQSSQQSISGESETLSSSVDNNETKTIRTTSVASKRSVLSSLNKHNADRRVSLQPSMSGESEALPNAVDNGETRSTGTTSVASKRSVLSSLNTHSADSRMSLQPSTSDESEALSNTTATSRSSSVANRTDILNSLNRNLESRQSLQQSNFDESETSSNVVVGNVS